jgi:RNA polymerase sigma factor (sigma-70 family)
MRFATGIPEIDGIDRFIQTCVWQAAKYTFNLGCRIDQEDLYQVGLIDAWKSYQEWDRSRGTSFLSFCGNQLRWRIFREVQNNCATVRIPVHAWAEGVRPTPCDEIDQALTLVTDNDFEAVQAKLDMESASRWLSVREKVLLLLRAEGHTLQVVSAAYGCTRERIRQIEASALAKLEVQVKTSAGRLPRKTKMPRRLPTPKPEQLKLWGGGLEPSKPKQRAKPGTKIAPHVDRTFVRKHSRQFGGTWTQTELAERFHTSQPYISLIIKELL